MSVVFFSVLFIFLFPWKSENKITIGENKDNRFLGLSSIADIFYVGEQLLGVRQPLGKRKSKRVFHYLLTKRLLYLS